MTARATESAVPASDHNEGVPGCFFSKEAEATYDRSVEMLARDHGIIK